MFFVRGDGMAEIGCGCRGGVAIVLFMDEVGGVAIVLFMDEGIYVNA